MKKGSTLFLKIAVICIGLPVLALCLFGLPVIAREAAGSETGFAYVMYGILAVMYAAAIPFFIALYQAFKLLNYIDNNKAFSELALNALKMIKYCAVVISGLYVAGMPLFYIFAELDDAPGVILIGAGFVFAPAVVAVFAAVLQKLFQHAIDIQYENDLTV
ncbi:DUF2975 domain-containing protein [Marinococcus halophilus]|uniref:Putative membrane protein YoaS n=1 Tax=Marinococcus halophilus TaxID=1371 RepID=A0A510YCC6_MARHA|nr:DUF2975 domain-containing protein [Marinococcus halophilus]OZT78745.1 DUF2975 domain-containing protein [Marinococcus halophilus]GEK60291.1 putative membrane protein YoaS [Marinococcus halophilus]